MKTCQREEYNNSSMGKPEFSFDNNVDGHDTQNAKIPNHNNIINSRHLPRIVETLIPPTNQPTIFIHTHDIIIIPINDILHRELIT